MALAKRPERDEEQGLQWDVQVGLSYRKDSEACKALQHTYQLMAKLRADMVDELVASEDVGGVNRKAIWVIDNLLRTPDLMVQRGREAERYLTEIRSRNG